MKNELFREYYAGYLKIKGMIKEGSKPGKVRKEAIENLYDLYYDAQKEQVPLSEVHEGTAEEYAEEILKSIPRRGVLKRWHFAVLAVLAVLILEAVLYFTSDSYLGVKQGLAYILNNAERYSFEVVETIPFKKRDGKGERYEIRFTEGKTEIIDGKDKYDYKSFENFIFDESGDKISLEVKIPYDKRAAIVQSHDLPVAIYCFSNMEEIFTEQNIIKLEAGESFYYGYFDYYRTEKNGDVYLGFEFIREEGPDAKEFILSGEEFFIDFGTIYEITWINKLEWFDFDYITAQEFYDDVNLIPFLNFREAEKYDLPESHQCYTKIVKISESGRFTVAGFVKIDLKQKEFLKISFIDENNFDDTAEFEVEENGFGVANDGKTAFVEVKYRIEGSEEWLREKVEFTFDDIE